MRPTTSASNLFRRALCPGSQRMEEGLPEEDSEDSREGQLLHDYAAHPEYKREVLKPEQRDLLELNESLIQNILERLKPSVGEPKINPFRELPLANGLITGTPDLVFEFTDTDYTVAVNDTKFGFKIVERADLNLQLRAYAVLVYDARTPTRRVFVSITQPRLAYSQRITIAEYFEEDIEASRVEIQKILERAGHDRAKLVAGEEQCRYCRAKLICPAFRKAFKHLVPLRNGSHNLSKAAREAYLAKRLSECSDKDLEKVLVACAFATVIKSQAHSEARRRIKAGGFTNYVLGNEYTVREIADPQKAISLLTLAGLSTRDQLLQICSLPLGKLEELYRKATKSTWKDAKDKINKVLKSVIETQEREPKIIRK